MKKVAVLEVRYPAFDPELDNAPERRSADPPSTPEPASARGGSLLPATKLCQPPGGYFRDMGRQFGTVRDAERMLVLGSPILADGRTQRRAA